MNKNELLEFFYHSVSIKWLTVAPHKTVVKLDKIRILLYFFKKCIPFQVMVPFPPALHDKDLIFKSLLRKQIITIYFSFAECLFCYIAFNIYF